MLGISKLSMGPVSDDGIILEECEDRHGASHGNGESCDIEPSGTRQLRLRGGASRVCVLRTRAMTRDIPQGGLAPHPTDINAADRKKTCGAFNGQPSACCRLPCVEKRKTVRIANCPKYQQKQRGSCGKQLNSSMGNDMVPTMEDEACEGCCRATQLPSSFDCSSNFTPYPPQYCASCQAAMCPHACQSYVHCSKSQPPCCTVDKNSACCPCGGCSGVICTDNTNGGKVNRNCRETDPEPTKEPCGCKCQTCSGFHPCGGCGGQSCGRIYSCAGSGGGTCCFPRNTRRRSGPECCGGGNPECGGCC